MCLAIYAAIHRHSAIDEKERLFITASFWSLHNPLVNCHQCLSRPKAEAIIMADRKRKGCFDRKDQPIFQNNGFNFHKCMGNYTLPSFPYIWEGYKVYAKGATPPWKLPSKLVDIYKILDNLVAEHESDQLEKAKNGRK